jgi:hypothetical protein
MSGAYTDRVGHRRTRTIGEVGDKRDWAGGGSSRDKMTYRETDFKGNVTNRSD